MKSPDSPLLCICGHSMYNHKDADFEYGFNQANCENCGCEYYIAQKKRHWWIKK